MFETGESSRWGWRAWYDNRVYQTQEEGQSQKYGSSAPAITRFRDLGFTPLTTSRRVIFEKFKNTMSFLSPIEMCLVTKESRRRSNNFCKFHKDYDHKTDHCCKLSAYFDSCVKEGRLKEYVHEVRRRTAEVCKPKNKRKRNHDQEVPITTLVSMQREKWSMSWFLAEDQLGRTMDTNGKWCIPRKQPRR